MTIKHPLATDYATEQPPARMVAGALAHLATHMSTGCPRAAMLAAMLLWLLPLAAVGASWWLTFFVW